VSEDAPRPESPSSGESAERPSLTPSLGDLFWVGTACALSVVIAGGAGYLLDSWLGTTPWLTFAGLAFGIVSAVMLGYKAVRRYT
jgi:uncharacterized membrane protein YgaE (UPF0421/DUF939 family)